MVETYFESLAGVKDWGSMSRNVVGTAGKIFMANVERVERRSGKHILYIWAAI